MCFPFQQPLRYIALAVRCKQGSQLHRKENQSTSVNLSQAGDQIEKWIARRARHSDLRRDQAAVSPSTCLERDNGAAAVWPSATVRIRFSVLWRRWWTTPRRDLCAVSVFFLQSFLHRCSAVQPQMFLAADKFGVIRGAALDKTFLARISFPPRKMKTKGFLLCPVVNVPSS